ncbi:MAG: sugar ABC transporter permease [Lachnospiraceae bacterium]|nr:sugar ABC transporter permease [Lachnospiraceae bacterium]
MKKGKKYWFNYLIFVGPVLLSFILFYIIPVILGFLYSMYDWNGISSNKVFVGMQNYIKLFTEDENYWISLKFSVKYAIASVVLVNVISMLMALWVNSKLRCSVFLRSCFFLPNVLCAVITGMLWKFVFNQIGPGLANATGISLFGYKLLSSPSTAWIAVLLVVLWQSCGYNMVIYIAGLVSIEPVYYESAAIDGAGRVRSFFSITLPLMMPSITITLFNTIAGAFRMFDINLSLTGGGPGRSTQGLALDVWKTAFSENRMGYGQAKAVILLVIVITIALIQTSVTRKKEVEM